MALKPLSDIIIVKRLPSADKTEGGIILPPVAQVELDEGLVVAAGPGKEYPNGHVVPNSIKAGDRVLFSKFANLGFKWEGDDLVTMHEADVIAVLE